LSPMSGALVAASIVMIFLTDVAILLGPVYRLLRHRFCSGQPSHAKRSSGL